MALVTVSLGSNIEAERHLPLAIQALHQEYAPLTLSPVYQTEAVGFDGDDFLNMVASFESDKHPQALARSLKAIEDEIGRDRDQPRFSARVIDLDLLTVDDWVMDSDGVQIPRHEITENAFVLKPLADIHGDQMHPVLMQTYGELWQEMKPNAGRIALFPLQFELGLQAD